MTTKNYCDACDQVIDAERTPVVPIKLQDGTTMAIEVYAVPAHRGNVHVCLYCALAALNDKDKRPRQSPAITGDAVKRYHRAELPMLVDRFLSWPVPDTELADPCASDSNYVRQHPESRTGTNFFSSIGARAMISDLLELDK